MKGEKGIMWSLWGNITAAVLAGALGHTLKEREEPLVVPGLSCGSERLHALSQVLDCSSCIPGPSVSDPALVSGQVRVVCWQLCFS